MPEHEVIQRVAEAFLTTPEKVLSRDKHRELVDARAVVVGVLRDRGPTALGRLLRRDHSTILNSERRYEREPELRRIAREIVD